MSIKCVYDQKVLLLSLSMHWIAVTVYVLIIDSRGSLCECEIHS